MAPTNEHVAKQPSSSKIPRRDAFGRIIQLSITGQGKVTGCRKRKQFRPRPSLPVHDPNFRGAYITMKITVGNSREPRLEMSCRFKLTNGRRYRRDFKRNQMRRANYTDNMRRNSVDNLIDEEEFGQSSSAPTNEKHCASCSAKKTPLWRDAEDGTPLCNACGIRYKKYKIRCTRCWHIPKKDEFSPTCISCGAGFQFAVAKGLM